MADFRPIKKATSQEREARIWALRVQGWSQTDIAKEVGVSQPAVAQAIKRASEKHYEKYMTDIHAYKQQQAALIEEAGLSALKQYYKSQQALTSTTKTGKYDETTKKFKGVVSTTVYKQSQTGDSKLLQAFFKSQEEIRKIWGIGALGKDATGKDGNKPDTSLMSIEEKVALFASIPIEERLKLIASLLNDKAAGIEPSQDADENNQ